VTARQLEFARPREVRRACERVRARGADVQNWRSSAVSRVRWREAQQFFGSVLNNLSTRFEALGRPKEAMAIQAESVSRLRALAIGLPHVYLPQLANALNTYGELHDRLGDSAQAIELLQAAAEIQRRLIAYSEGYLADLARSLFNLAAQYAKADQVDAQEQLLREAYEHAAQAVARGHLAARTIAAQALALLGGVKLKQNRFPEGVDALSAACAVQQSLADETPSVHEPDYAAMLLTLSAALENCGNDLRALAELDGAVTRLEKHAVSGGPMIVTSLLDARTHREQLIARLGLLAPATGDGLAIVQPRRNDPCPCGSGRKYKRCHGEK
jgi:tetratricopeptide (TPR) repeat protein